MENYLNTDKSIIISAPAGSGKTEKLARRYIALLQSGVNVERVLAITFTDKAAAEMKQRILRILKAEDSELYMSLMGSMPLMRVTTIHAFCGTLLRRFSFEASIDPNYRIEDAVDSRMVWEEILYEILMEAGKGERGHEIFFQTLSEKGFRGLDYLRSTIGYLYQKNPFSLEASTLRHVSPVPGHVIEELLSWPGVKDVLDHYEDFLNSDNYKNIAGMEKYFLTDKKEPRKKSVPLLKGIADYRDWAEKMYLVWTEKKVRQNTERAARIRDIFGQCLDKYNDRKRAKGTLDFSDLEHLAYRMLTEHPEWANILYAFDEKTDHILVDEFQDTNSFQWAIVNSLTEEWRSGMGAKREEGTKPTVFFVGDEKQSVYYFRGANVEIFSRAKDRLQEWLGDEFCYEEIRDNYRSLPAIIDFTNHVFSRIMQTGEKPYPWITTYTTFNAHRSGVPDRGRIEIIMLDNEDDATAEAREAEAEILAQRIRSLEGNYQITDKQSRQQRPCRFMDMAILLRKRTHLKKYEEALKQHNIPYVAVKGIGFYQEPEVAMLRSLIFFLSDPHDDYSLYVLLKSPLFRIEESDILELLNSEGSSLFDKLTAGSRNEDTPGSLFDEPGPARSCTGGAVADAAVTLTTWLAESAVTAISILIERVLVKTKAWMFFHDKQRQANIRKFIRIVEDLETNGKSLIKIRDVLERTADKSDEAKANVNTEGMDAVRIMTIHASKGLEFPIVFAPGMEEPFGVKTGENLIYEREGSFFYKSEPESSIRKQDEDFLIHQAREEEEQKRLFYVLVTRAEEALFLLGRWSSRDKNFLSFLRQGLGLEKEGAAFSLEADINGLSVLSGEDVNMLYAHAPSHTTEKKTLETITVFPLSIQKQTPWKSVTRTLESKGQDGQSRVSMGDILHRLFEGVSKGTISESDIMSRADIILQSMGFHDIAKDEKLELIEKEINTLKDTGVWQDIILPAEDSYTELPFVLGSEESIYSGRIDRMIKKDNVCRIYDYKTFPVTENEIPHLLKKYSIQLNIYKKAVQQIFNTDKVESYVVFTHTGEVKEV